METSQEHLKVAVRVRPILPSEPLREEIVFIGEVTPKQDHSLRISDGEHYLEIKYDQVFPPSSTQSEVYEFVKIAIEGCAKGYNCTLFAYGQTGSGKTYTMFGAEWERNNPAPQVYYNRARLRGQRNLPSSLVPASATESLGIIPKAIQSVFSSISSKSYTCYCSFIQIYNEKLYDLLQDPARTKALSIREDKESGIYVEHLAEFVVETESDCYELIRTGDKNRAVRQTKYNNHSSRSHTIFQLLLESDRANKRGALKRAKLNLCDLAGSEKYDKSGNMLAGHVKELANINQSLSTLGKVISALATAAAHVPYRDSKLTRLLQDSLGANTRTILIATITPTMARQVLVKVHKNEVSATSDKLVTKLQREIQYLKSLLSLRRKGGVESIEQELWTLREENQKLREISGKLSIEEVEKLREENKRLKVELQRINKDSGGALGSAGSFGGMYRREESQSEDKPTSAMEVMSTPDGQGGNFSGKDEDIPQAEDVYQLMANQGADVKETLNLIRKHELQLAGAHLKRRIIAEGRCPICTLKVPCSHYADITALPDLKSVAEPPKLNGIILNISSGGESPNIGRFPQLRGRKEEKHSRRSSNVVGTPKTREELSYQRRALSYRYRGPSKVSGTQPGRLIELKAAEGRKKALREAERKLQLLEKLEHYREEKLRSEIEKLEAEKQAEELQAQLDKEKEEKRLQYLQKQKQKLRSYELQRLRSEEEAKKKALLEESKRKRAEKKAAKERDIVKKKLEDYHRKKQMIDGITRDQVQELGMHYLEEEVILRRSQEDRGRKDSEDAVYDGASV